ncbi:MAG: lysophospholipid acyltransferase family protein [Pseudomonadota bacterium]
MRWLMSLLFTVQAYFMMFVWGIVFAPWAIFSPKGARMACKTWAAYAMWTARLMVGIHTEVRGTPPTGEVLIAAKHQSFLDILMIFNALPAAKFIMKRELMWTPIIGIYAYRLGCVPVARGKRGAAIAKMVADVEAGRAAPGQLVIYSQGTRVAPGAYLPYKVGTAVLYQQLGQPCVPVATNAGLFWPRSGILRHPGTAVVEFLPPLAPGVGKDEFMTQIEDVVEARSNALMEEAGFHADR